MGLTLDIIGVIVALSLIGYTYVKWSLQYWKRKNIPYIEPTFLIGNTENPFWRTRSMGEVQASYYLEARKRGLKYIGIYMLMRPTLMIADPDLLKSVMTKDFNYFVGRGGYVNEEDEPISAHLFSLSGIKWRNLRMKLTPTFTSGKMRMMFQTLADCGVELEEYIDDFTKKNNNEPFDIKNVLACFSTNIIGSCAFGLECNTFKEPDSPFRYYSNKIFVPPNSLKIFRILKMVIAQSYPTLAKKLHLKIFPTDVAEFFTDLVQKMVDYREKNNVERKDFLQMLIDIKNNKDGSASGQKGDGTSLTMDEMVAQSFVFFIAGFETSSTTMTFALYELATHQDIQDKVREEIHRVLKKHDNKITYDSLKELVYMDQVVDESLRKYPPVPILTRECGEDYALPNTDIVIEKGTRVLIPIRGLHYDEEYYPNPEVFDPERFSEENKKNRHQYVHIPFGEGPRICIGQRFGVMQSKVGILSVLRNHRVTLSEKTQVPLKIAVNSFIPTAEGGIWLNIEKL